MNARRPGSAGVEVSGGRGAVGRRARWAGWVGVVGAGLGVVAGVVQATVGSRIPEWTGAKGAPVALGLLTVALSVLAGACALLQRRPLPAGARAACALGLAGPGLLCLSTVGRLWWLPAVLLVVAAVLTVDARTAAAVAARDRWRILLGALGLCELLMAAGAAPLGLAVGAVGGLALVAAAFLARGRTASAVALAVGTLPFAVLGWTALVPVLLAVVAVTVAVPLLRTPRPA